MLRGKLGGCRMRPPRLTALPTPNAAPFPIHPHPAGQLLRLQRQFPRELPPEELFSTRLSQLQFIGAANPTPAVFLPREEFKLAQKGFLWTLSADSTFGGSEEKESGEFGLEGRRYGCNGNEKIVEINSLFVLLECYNFCLDSLRLL